MQQGAGWLRSDFLSEDEIARERAHSLGVPFVLLTQDDISTDALVMLPEPLSRAHSAVAYAAANGLLEVAFVSLEGLEKISALYPHIKIKPRLTTQGSIKQALMLYQKHLKEKFGGALQAGESEALILHALLNQASDIHLDVLPAGTRVRYRIGGVLHEAMRLSAQAGALLTGGLKQLAKLFPMAAAQEGKFKMQKDDGIVMVSVANVPAVGGEKLTLRLTHEYSGQHAGAQGFTLSALGLHGTGLEKVHSMLHKRHGLVLVAGKSETGKTTTLYTLLDHIRGSEQAVVTIEEQIEYHVPHATQTQAKPALGLSMLAGLRAALRTDPDVVMIGNLESAEVAEVALEAASRGVLVFAAIDARSSAAAIEKLLSWGIQPALFARELVGVIAQTLVKKLPAGFTGSQDKLSREESAFLEEGADPDAGTGVNFARVLAELKEEGRVESYTSWKDLMFYRSEEANGLTGLQEVLAVTSAVKELIAGEAGAGAIERQAREEGMLTLAEDALFKAAAGIVSLERAVEVAGE